jgi:hypothetical protein
VLVASSDKNTERELVANTNPTSAGRTPLRIRIVLAVDVALYALSDATTLTVSTMSEELAVVVAVVEAGETDGNVSVLPPPNSIYFE